MRRNLILFYQDCAQIVENPKNTKGVRRVNYSLNTHEVDVHFMSNYHQEASFILSPKDEEYAPNMDALENSKAQRGKEITVIDWDKQEYPLTKFVILSVDSVYLVILQVFGRSLEDPYPRTNKTEQFVKVDCVQAFGTERTLSTKSWTCLNGDRILLENVSNLNPLNLGYYKSGKFLCRDYIFGCIGNIYLLAFRME